MPGTGPPYGTDFQMGWFQWANRPLIFATPLNTGYSVRSFIATKPVCRAHEELGSSNLEVKQDFGPKNVKKGYK
jgi:hypothetical protein